MNKAVYQTCGGRRFWELKLLILLFITDYPYHHDNSAQQLSFPLAAGQGSPLFQKIKFFVKPNIRDLSFLKESEYLHALERPPSLLHLQHFHFHLLHFQQPRSLVHPCCSCLHF